MIQKGTCPICSQENIDVNSRFPQRNDRVIECPVCGIFIITNSLSDWINAPQFHSSAEKALLPYLSSHTKQETQKKITAELDSDNWQELALLHKSTSASQKVMKLLELLGKRSRYPGDEVRLSGAFDYPLLDAIGKSEFDYLMEHVAAAGYVKSSKSTLGSFSTALTIKGWERLEPIGGGGIPGRCFVAMSFDKSLDDAYTQGIYPSLKDDCDLEPRRIDLFHHNEKICDKILSEIRLASLLVADFTLHKAGVYFEAGFAMALGRPVIWTCRDDEISKAHFDTRQYNHIIWSTPVDLRTKLTERIRATIFSDY